MRITRLTLALGLTLTLALPALAAPITALGQSAGDDQYVDPFQNQDESRSGQQGSQTEDGSGGGSGGGSTTPPAESGVEGSAPPVDLDAGGADLTASGGEALPRTGVPAAALAGIGLLLLSGGLALRRRA